MDIRFNSDNNLDGSADLAEAVHARITERLETRFGARLTTIEVHVRDVDGLSNRSDGVEATLEARPEGGKPLVVSGRAEKPFEAVNSALGTLVTRLDAVFGKADRHRK
ncbi:MAG: HPF/RaiA family ribosome-associated protein [Erythrobacter sp.]